MLRSSIFFYGNFAETLARAAQRANDRGIRQKITRCPCLDSERHGPHYVIADIQWTPAEYARRARQT